MGIRFGKKKQEDTSNDRAIAQVIQDEPTWKRPKKKERGKLDRTFKSMEDVHEPRPLAAEFRSVSHSELVGEEVAIFEAIEASKPKKLANQTRVNDHPKHGHIPIRGRATEPTSAARAKHRKSGLSNSMDNIFPVFGDDHKDVMKKNK